MSVKSKRRGLNKASGAQKAELSEILINNRTSIKGRLIGQRQRDCSALNASPLRNDSTHRDRLRRKRRDRWMRRMTRNKGRTDSGAEGRGREQTILLQLQRERGEGKAKFLIVFLRAKPPTYKL